VKYRASTDADYTSKSNASPISVLLTAPGWTPDSRINHLQSLQPAGSSGLAKAFQVHVRGPHGAVSSKCTRVSSVPSATANHGTMNSTQSSDLEYILRHSITNALPECANTSNGHDRHQRLLALPSSTTRRFLAVTKSNTFADAHPETDAIPVTILRETERLLRCSLPHTLNSPLLDTIHNSTSITFKDYFKTLPTWEQDLLINAIEKPSNVPLYELLSSQHATLLAVSDGGADVPKNYGCFGWVLGTEHEIPWECKGIARGYPMQSYRAEGYGRISLRLFLAHYILYMDIQTSDELCITSYCDNQSFLKNEEKIHTRDIDSSSWYTNPDHDAIMTLSALRTKLTFQLASLHVRGHQDKHCEFELLTRPQQLNVLADQLATEVLEDLRAADKPTKLYPLPACRAYLRDGTGHITSNEKRMDFRSTKSERTYNSGATVGMHTP
jgi:hypothetical protein